MALGDLRQIRFKNRERRDAFLAAILNRKAATLKNFGRIEDALDAGEEALKRFKRIGDQSMMVETLFDLGAILFALPRRRHEARKLFDEGSHIYLLNKHAMREPAPCRYSYVRSELAIHDHDFTTAYDFCKSGAKHAERVGNSFWGIRLLLLEAVAHLLTAGRDKSKLKAVNELLIKARDWANVSHADRSRWAISYLDGKFLVRTGDYARATRAFSEAINALAMKLGTPEQVAWKSPLLRDIAATCRRYGLSLDKAKVFLLLNGAVQAEIFEILAMSDKTFKAFERRRIPEAAFVYRNEAIESP
jgi:tetratricopeptide (TPR) repeat protein